MTNYTKFYLALAAVAVIYFAVWLFKPVPPPALAFYPESAEAFAGGAAWLF